MNPDDAYNRYEFLKNRVYSRFLQDLQEDDDLISGDFARRIIPDEWMDEGLEPTVPPTAYNAVNNASDHILSAAQTFVPIRPVDDSMEASRERSENQRRFHDMWWARVHEDQGAPLERAKKKLIRGKLVLKKTIKFDILPDLSEDPTPVEKRRFTNAVKKAAKSKFLWNLEVIPSETVFEDPITPWDPAYVYEAYDIYAGDVATRFHDFEDEYGVGDPMRKLPYVEMWTKPYKSDPGSYIIWIEGRVVHEAANPYSWVSYKDDDGTEMYDGYVPYAIADPGYGETDADCNPEDRYVSILKPIRSVLTSEARFLTEMEAWLRMYVFPALVTVNMDELEDGEKEFRLGPGTHLNIRPDQQVDILRWGEAPITLMQGLQRVNNYADEASKFGALGGAPMIGIESATESEQVMRNAATKLAGPISGMQRCCQKINGWVLADIENILKTEVTLSASFTNSPNQTTLSPKDIDGYYYTNVTFETTDENMINSRKARLWADLYRIMPGMSERTAMDNMGITDPTSEQDERSIEDLMRSAPMQNVQTLVALAGLGEIGQEVMRIMSQNQPPSAAQPPMGSAESPPMGDEQLLTATDPQGNPVEPVMTDARRNAQAQFSARQAQ